MRVTPDPTKRPMIVADPQGFSVPPHIIARSSIKIAGIKIAHPIRSRFLIRWRAVRSRWIDGGVKNKNIATNVTAPGGRLIQKHHRQVAFCVKAPPITGARIRPIAKQLLHIPMRSGFALSEATVRTIINPPLATPDAPIPATARPTIKLLLFGAKPQIRLPIIKMEKNIM